MSGVGRRPGVPRPTGVHGNVVHGDCVRTASGIRRRCRVQQECTATSSMVIASAPLRASGGAAASNRSARVHRVNGDQRTKTYPAHRSVRHRSYRRSPGQRRSADENLPGPSLGAPPQLPPFTGSTAIRSSGPVARRRCRQRIADQSGGPPRIAHPDRSPAGDAGSGSRINLAALRGSLIRTGRPHQPDDVPVRTESEFAL